MTNQYFKDIMIVGDVRKAISAMEDYLGYAPNIQLSEEALARWNDLERRYEEFYELPIEERLIKSGMKQPPTNQSKERTE